MAGEFDQKRRPQGTLLERLLSAIESTAAAEWQKAAQRRDRLQVRSSSIAVQYEYGICSVGLPLHTAVMFVHDRWQLPLKDRMVSLSFVKELVRSLKALRRLRNAQLVHDHRLQEPRVPVRRRRPDMQSRTSASASTHGRLLKTR